jgi:hypothetical protein
MIPDLLKKNKYQMWKEQNQELVAWDSTETTTLEELVWNHIMFFPLFKDDLEHDDLQNQVVDSLDFLFLNTM